MKVWEGVGEQQFGPVSPPNQRCCAVPAARSHSVLFRASLAPLADVVEAAGGSHGVDALFPAAAAH